MLSEHSGVWMSGHPSLKSIAVLSTVPVPGDRSYIVPPNNSQSFHPQSGTYAPAASFVLPQGDTLLWPAHLLTVSYVSRAQFYLWSFVLIL